jgi:hypothetical protein
VDARSAIRDRVFFEPGEEHWHGAAATRFMTHLALLEVDDEGKAATWGDHLSDEEYAAAPAIDRVGPRSARRRAQLRSCAGESAGQQVDVAGLPSNRSARVHRLAAEPGEATHFLKAAAPSEPPACPQDLVGKWGQRLIRRVVRA